MAALRCRARAGLHRLSAPVPAAGFTVRGNEEQLAGFYLVDARDLNGAIRIAAGIPPARVGSIEVRPVRALRPVTAPKETTA